jgi:hypothetical protein
VGGKRERRYQVPETNTVEVLTELLDGLRKATSLEEMNVAAGEAYQVLTGTSEAVPA